MKIHIVQQGDTMWKIAKQYGVDLEELLRANNQLKNPDRIMPGMKIKVPARQVPLRPRGEQKETYQVPARPRKEMPVAPEEEEPRIPSTLPRTIEPETIEEELMQLEKQRIEQERRELQQNIEPNIRGNVEPNIKDNVEPNLRPNAEPNLRPNVEPNLRPNVEPNLRPNVEPNLRPNVQPDVKPYLQPNVKPNVKPNTERSIQKQPMERSPAEQMPPTGRGYPPQPPAYRKGDPYGYTKTPPPVMPYPMPPSHPSPVMPTPPASSTLPSPPPMPYASSMMPYPMMPTPDTSSMMPYPMMPMPDTSSMMGLPMMPMPDTSSMMVVPMMPMPDTSSMMMVPMMPMPDSSMIMAPHVSPMMPGYDSPPMPNDSYDDSSRTRSGSKKRERMSDGRSKHDHVYMSSDYSYDSFRPYSYSTDSTPYMLPHPGMSSSMYPPNQTMPQLPHSEVWPSWEKGHEESSSCR